jgi:hypothetical protein
LIALFLVCFGDPNYFADVFNVINTLTGDHILTQYLHLALETHTYLIFDQGLVSMSRDAQSEFPCRDWKNDLAHSKNDFGQTMVGEFSSATNDCAKYLNGIGMGARYDGTFTTGQPAVCKNCTCNGTEDWENWSDEYKQFLMRFIERQMDSFETGIGWFFWNFKTENHINPHWDYLLGWVISVYNLNCAICSDGQNANFDYLLGTRMGPQICGQSYLRLCRCL